MNGLDEKLNRVLARHDELSRALASAGGLDGERFQRLSKEYARPPRWPRRSGI